MKLLILPSELNRWHMAGRSRTFQEDTDFCEWMANFYPECECIHRFNDGDPFWSVRGGDPETQAMILLRWQDD